MDNSAIVQNGVVTRTMVGGIPGSISCGPEVGAGWLYDGEEFTAPPEPEPEIAPPTLAEQAKAARAAAYRNEADPLFFKWQRGGATEQEWLDKIAEIKSRYPYPR